MPKSMTQPEKLQVKAVRILQITDPHLFGDPNQTLLNVNTTESLQGVVNYIKTHEKAFDLVLATGDITQDESEQSYQNFLDLLADINAPLIGLPGNHDDNDQLKAVWGDRLQTIYDIGRWRLVLLDSTIPGSNAGHLDNSQFQLLEDAVAQAPDRHVLVAMHHNPVPVGSQWLDTMFIDNGAKLLRLLDKLPQVKALLWGHVHQEFDDDYQRSAANTSGTSQAVRLLATPSSCVQFKPNTQQFALDTLDPGYRVLELADDGQIKTDVIRVPNLNLQPDTNSAGY